MLPYRRVCKKSRAARSCGRQFWARRWFQWAAAGKNRCIRESTRAVISPDGWKLCLRDFDKSELYNLGNDPGERQNLFYRSEGREGIGHLRNAIYAW
jgi:hypothetical protein